MGTELQLGQDDAVLSPPSPETFAAVGEITNLGKSGAKADTVDVTNMQSPNGFREFISGLREAGEVSCTVNLVVGDDTQDSVEGLFETGERRNWRIVVPPAAGEVSSPGYYEFKAIVSGYGDATFTPDKQISVTFKLKISGTYEFVAA
jgi:predicted secreted protein